MLIQLHTKYHCGSPLTWPYQNQYTNIVDNNDATVWYSTPKFHFFNSIDAREKFDFKLRAI